MEKLPKARESCLHLEEKYTCISTCFPHFNNTGILRKIAVLIMSMVIVYLLLYSLIPPKYAQESNFQISSLTGEINHLSKWNLLGHGTWPLLPRTLISHSRQWLDTVHLSWLKPRTATLAPHSNSLYIFWICESGSQLILMMHHFLSCCNFNASTLVVLSGLLWSVLVLVIGLYCIFF